MIRKGGSETMATPVTIRALLVPIRALLVCSLQLYAFIIFVRTSDVIVEELMGRYSRKISDVIVEGLLTS